MKKSRYEALYDSLIDALNHRKATDLEKTEKIKHQASVEVALRIDLDRLNVLLSEKNTSYDTLCVSYDLARNRIAELEKMLDQACTRDEDNHRTTAVRIDILNGTVEQLAERNRFYGELLFAVTGNRYHETAVNIQQQADQLIGAIQADVRPTVFCKSAIGLNCRNPNDGQQCAMGECMRVVREGRDGEPDTIDQTDYQPPVEAMRPVPKVCEHCGRPIGRGPGMCHGSCDLPF